MNSTWEFDIFAVDTLSDLTNTISNISRGGKWRVGNSDLKQIWVICTTTCVISWYVHAFTVLKLHIWSTFSYVLLVCYSAGENINTEQNHIYEEILFHLHTQKRKGNLYICELLLALRTKWLILVGHEQSLLLEVTSKNLCIGCAEHSASLHSVFCSELWGTYAHSTHWLWSTGVDQISENYLIFQAFRAVT